MDNKKTLGTKSYKFIFLETVAFFISVILSLLFIYDYSQTTREISLIFGILSICCIVFVSYILTKALIRPKFIVEVDEKGVYLNFSKKRIVYILFRDIENVYGDRISALTRGTIYKFGTLYVQTKNKKYKIGVINDIQEIEKYIYSKIAWKFKY